MELRPPSNVTFSLQLGKDGLMPPTSASDDLLTFDLTVRVNTRVGNTDPDLRGSLVDGRPGARFLYVNSGTLAGQKDSCWTRRAKVPLIGLTWTEVKEALSVPGAVLEARVEGTARVTIGEGTVGGELA